MVESEGADVQSDEGRKSILTLLWRDKTSSFSFSSSSSASSLKEVDSEKAFYLDTFVFSAGLLAALFICIFVRSSRRLHVCLSLFTILHMFICIIIVYIVAP